MEDCHLENLGDLLHLRYLKLTCPGISGLPKKKKIGNLKFLQTLDVREAAIKLNCHRASSCYRIWCAYYVELISGLWEQDCRMGLES
jgi:hypothetical protein